MPEYGRSCTPRRGILSGGGCTVRTYVPISGCRARRARLGRGARRPPSSPCLEAVHRGEAGGGLARPRPGRGGPDDATDRASGGGNSRVHAAASGMRRSARTREVSLEQARRIAVRAQLLDGSARGVLETVRALGFLQLDPIATVA